MRQKQSEMGWARIMGNETKLKMNNLFHTMEPKRVQILERAREIHKGQTGKKRF